ncbi:hypothetical protein AUL38_03795 [Leucobacter sp. G161]|nr:hypothetical protein AUL38_03795 [Leucobacter sp. G161]
MNSATQIPPLVQLAPHHEVLRSRTMPDALLRLAKHRRDSLALQEIEGLQRSLTWGELHELVERVRSGLERAGLRAGERVGVLLRNQIEFPVVWLAVMSAGAAIVPLNPKYTTREVEALLRDADAAWLIGATDLLLPHFATQSVGGVDLAQVIAVGTPRATESSEQFSPGWAFADISEAPLTKALHIGSPLDVVNIQFTSGTTGLPKGCLLTHEYWIELGVHSAAAYGDPQRYLADFPFYYMQNQAYFAMALASGGALYIAPGLSRRKMMGWLLDCEIDFAWVSEEMLQFEISEADSRLALRYAPVAGMPASAYGKLRERFGIEARESYASTEVGSAIGVPRERLELAGTGTMGACLPNRQSKVVGADLREVPPNTPGELCIRGRGMMLGYHNRPEANADLFLPGGWFRTGDIVTKTEDGLHYFVGRAKDMIRRSGENISAVEVEMHLLGMDGVNEVAVIPVQDEERGEEAKAIVVRSALSIEVADLVDWAKTGLAPFKVPRFFEFRSELPRTESGKVAKATLKAEPAMHSGVVDTRAGIRTERKIQ